MKKIIWISIVMTILVSAVIAGKPNLVPATNNKAGVVVTIPVHAVEVADNVFSLGIAQDVDGRIVEGYAIFKYKKGFGKPGTECGNGVCEPGENAKKCPADCDGGGGGEEPPTSSCYSFLARGAKWKSVEDYIVNPSNGEGLDDSFVTSNLAMDVDKWESVSGANIMGSGSSTTEILIADTESPDGDNEVYFGDISSPGAIGVTIVWGIFSGPPKWRELVEWDQVYDEVDFDWSAVGEAGKMDFENIATHELGHSIGMGHPPDECTEETMYRFADYGETKKRSLEAGDITGVKKLYN